MESQQFVVLTDKDSAEVEPIMKMIATIDEYHRSVHMLSKKFKEFVYPNLPHEPGGNKLN